MVISVYKIQNSSACSVRATQHTNYLFILSNVKYFSQKKKNKREVLNVKIKDIKFPMDVRLAFSK